jgi:hypothetical protein
MENIKKTYSPAEAAVKILERVKELYKSSNLNKANTAHEIEVGQEPHTQNTECPEQLAEGENIKKAKKKHNDSGNEIGDEEVGEEDQELLEGGQADGIEDDDFDNEDLEVGTELEGEHTNNPDEAKEVAKDHLAGKKDYYQENGKAAGADIGKEVKDIKENDEENEENEVDKDRDDIIDDVVDSNSKGKEKKEKKGNPFGKSENFNESMSPKLHKFMQDRVMRKAKMSDVQKDNHRSAKVVEPSGGFTRDRGKYKEQIEANRNPSNDMKNRQNRKRNKKKAVVVSKEKGNRDVRRKISNHKVEKMLGIKDQAKEAYKKPEIPKIPKINEGY